MLRKKSEDLSGVSLQTTEAGEGGIDKKDHALCLKVTPRTVDVSGDETNRKHSRRLDVVCRAIQGETSRRSNRLQGVDATLYQRRTCMRIDNTLTPTRTATGVVCISKGQVLVVSSLKGPYTVLPKGGLEDGLSFGENALKELAEEAGMIGDLGPVVFDNNVVYDDGRVQREVYFLVLNPSYVDWEEENIRERRFLDLINAMDALSPVQRTVVLNAFDHYEGG